MDAECLLSCVGVGIADTFVDRGLLVEGDVKRFCYRWGVRVGNQQIRC